MAERKQTYNNINKHNTLNGTTVFLCRNLLTHTELSLFLLQNFYNEIKKDEMYDR